MIDVYKRQVYKHFAAIAEEKAETEAAWNVMFAAYCEEYPEMEEDVYKRQEHNRELRVRMKTLFQSQRVPSFCQSGFYYALYFPRGFREIITFLLTFAVCLLLVPYGVYSMLPDKKTCLLYTSASELMLFSYACTYLGIPTAFVSGDEAICEKAKMLNPLIAACPVKRGIGAAVAGLHPEKAEKMLEDSARKALEGNPDRYTYKLPPEFHVTVSVSYTHLADRRERLSRWRKPKESWRKMLTSAALHLSLIHISTASGQYRSGQHPSI